jgi:hypothetical protein
VWVEAKKQCNAQKTDSIAHLLNGYIVLILYRERKLLEHHETIWIMKQFGVSVECSGAFTRGGGRTVVVVVVVEQKVLI